MATVRGRAASTAYRTFIVTNSIDPCDQIPYGNKDTDGEGIADVRDLDDDNDGCKNVIESGFYRWRC